MYNFKNIDNRYKVPIYFQKLPTGVNSVALNWVYFVGSADDELVGGKPGLFHWFEHVPFRGTKKFPGGYQAIDRPIARHGGSINASTTELATAFDISIPKNMWRQGLDLVSDVAFRPLIRTKDVEAEREVIHKEIIASQSDVEDSAWERASQILYPDHPLGHSIVGSPKTLGSMNASHLREAFKRGYDRWRMAFLASGDLNAEELREAVYKAFEKAPNHDLPSRTFGECWKRQPWSAGKTTVEKTGFPSSIVMFLFQFPAWTGGGDSPDQVWRHSMAQEMLWAGDLASPLYQVLREDRNLVYEISDESAPFMGGGHWGFTVETSPGDEKEVVRAFWDVVRDRKNRSRERFEYVRDTIRGRIAMVPLHPSSFVEHAQEHLIRLGELASVYEAADKLLAQPYNKVVEVMEGLNENMAQTIIMKGTR